MVKIRKLVIGILCMWLLISTSACSSYKGEVVAESDREIVVFAAASLTEVCQLLKKDYEAEHPDVRIIYNFAGSQVLSNQIIEGGQPHMFFSANETYVDHLIEESVNPYDLESYEPVKDVFASNQLVLIYADDYDFESFDACVGLLKEDVYHPVILAFEEVPVGKYTKLMMDNYLQMTEDQEGYKRFYDQVVSYESDVKAVLAKVKIHEGDVGIVYRTDAINLDLAANELKYLDIEDTYNMVASYGALVFSDDENAADFYEFVTEGKGQDILRANGF